MSPAGKKRQNASEKAPNEVSAAFAATLAPAQSRYDDHLKDKKRGRVKRRHVESRAVFRLALEGRGQ